MVVGAGSQYQHDAGIVTDSAPRAGAVPGWQRAAGDGTVRDGAVFRANPGERPVAAAPPGVRPGIRRLRRVGGWASRAPRSVASGRRPPAQCDTAARGPERPSARCRRRAPAMSAQRRSVRRRGIADASAMSCSVPVGGSSMPARWSGSAGLGNTGGCAPASRGSQGHREVLQRHATAQDQLAPGRIGARELPFGVGVEVHGALADAPPPTGNCGSTEPGPPAPAGPDRFVIGNPLLHGSTLAPAPGSPSAQRDRSRPLVPWPLGCPNMFAAGGQTGSMVTAPLRRAAFAEPEPDELLAWRACRVCAGTICMSEGDRLPVHRADVIPATWRGRVVRLGDGLGPDCGSGSGTGPASPWLLPANAARRPDRRNLCPGSLRGLGRRRWIRQFTTVPAVFAHQLPGRIQR